jgi:hypothetical protein
MSNEPVAWFEQDPDMKSVWYQADKDAPNAIPLYTHPAKTLTDEEIWELAQPYGDLPWQDCTLEFARAILRKAQDE